MRAFVLTLTIVAATFAALTLYARAQGVAEGRAMVRDAGIDPVVASDHGPRPVADLPDPPPTAKAAPGLVDRVLDVAGPVGRGALGGIACLVVAWLLARARDRWGWLRRGWAGNAAATAYAALGTFGAVLAIGGSVGAGLTAVGGAMAAGMALGRDPGTVRREAKPAAGEIEVPT